MWTFSFFLQPSPVEATMKVAMFSCLLFFKTNQPEPIKLVAIKDYYGLTLVIIKRAAKYKWVQEP